MLKVQRQKTKEKAITLIALVITIIVLLILAGVTIAALSGKNGMLQEAQEANLQRWPLSYLNNPDLWIETHYHENYSSLTSLEQHYTYLKDHLSARIDILDQAYLL